MGVANAWRFGIEGVLSRLASVHHQNTQQRQHLLGRLSWSVVCGLLLFALGLISLFTGHVASDLDWYSQRLVKPISFYYKPRGSGRAPIGIWKAKFSELYYQCSGRGPRFTLRMDSLQDPFFSNLIHDGSNLGNQFMESQYVSQVGQVAQKESQFSVETEPVAKKRGGNFSIEEDNMLVSAWLNISLDAVQGNGQKPKTFWIRVWEFFHENKTFTSGRNDNSLMNRWSTIQLSTNKFCGYLAQIEAAHQSGMTEQDKIREAKIMYQDLDVKHFAFQFEHCWDVLKHQPKWFQECEKKKPKRGRTVATPLAELVNPEEDVADDIIEVERPIGNKIAKEQRKKNKTNDHASAPIVQILNELKEDKKAANEKKHQML
ncbi:hypothetical protein RHMOL_Rhmol07G0253900 [Rhododendron molle]|uniref:Uncharacterized protein n=1 Tax=Rhododendron molle TaxID=49168 RepID=A0ACC0N5P0_RHOML|nr:hypothetical protein RHMOL_Rhmol07G0253900 [Rhododendron molle]